LLIKIFTCSITHVLYVKQKILVTLLEKGALQNSEIAKRVGITEQWCSEIINTLYTDDLIDSEFVIPRRINKLTDRGIAVAKHLKEIDENILNLKTMIKMSSLNHGI
jgi:predicted transcriptional regulator